MLCSIGEGGGLWKVREKGVDFYIYYVSGRGCESLKRKRRVGGAVS